MPRQNALGILSNRNICLKCKIKKHQFLLTLMGVIAPRLHTLDGVARPNFYMCGDLSKKSKKSKKSKYE